MERELPAPPKVGVDTDLKYRSSTSRKMISVLTDIRTNQLEAYGFFKNQTVANAYTESHLAHAEHISVKHAFPSGKTHSHLKVDINRWVIITDYLNDNRMTATGFFQTQKQAYSHIKYIMADLVNSLDHKLYVLPLKPYHKLLDKK